MDFLADNYLWFLIGGVVLLLALIGFMIDSRKKAKKAQETDQITDEFTPANDTQPLNDIPLAPGETQAELTVDTPDKEITITEDVMPEPAPAPEAPMPAAPDLGPAVNAEAPGVDIPLEQEPVLGNAVPETTIEPITPETPTLEPAPIPEAPAPEAAPMPSVEPTPIDASPVPDVPVTPEVTPTPAVETPAQEEVYDLNKPVE